MCPNIFSCDPKWFEKLKTDQKDVVVVGWCGDDEKCNAYVEEIAKLEARGIPVFVIDKDSCPTIAEQVGVKSAGETVVFHNGEEVGRLTPESIETAVQQIEDKMKE